MKLEKKQYLIVGLIVICAAFIYAKKDDIVSFAKETEKKFTNATSSKSQIKEQRDAKPEKSLYFSCNIF